MTKNYLPGWGKTAWQNNKPFLVFAASLLILLSVLKIVFYQYNYSFVFGDGNRPRLLLIGGWSLITDLVTVLFLSLPFLLLLHLAHILNNRIINTGIVSVWIVLNAFMLLLNLADIFYFRFHFQRADADLRQGIKDYSNWPTIPQLYVKGEFVGGCDIVREMFQSGELADQLNKAGVPAAQPARD